MHLTVALVENGHPKLRFLARGRANLKAMPCGARITGAYDVRFRDPFASFYFPGKFLCLNMRDNLGITGSDSVARRP